MNGRDFRVVGARSFLALVVLFTLVLGLLGYIIIQNHELATQGQEAHDALCVFRSDLSSRADQGDQFIADIVSGRRDPIPGITIADLQRSVAGQRSTLQALSILDC